jgi:hypothetical protein
MHIKFLKKNGYAIAFLSIVSLVLFNAFNLGFPILGSDEYAYFINAKYIDNLSGLHTLEPHLQKTPTLLYLKLLNLLQSANLENFVIIYRFLQIIIYLCIGKFLKYIFLKYQLLNRNQARISFLIYLLLPCAFYVNTVMPEILTMLIPVLTLYLLLMHRSKANLIFLGILLGAGLLIKPNVIATILTANLFILYDTYLKSKKISQALFNLIFLNISLYVSTLIITKFIVGDWDLLVRYGLGADFYGKYVAGGISQFMSKIYAFLWYFLAHTLILIGIFSPIFLGLINRKSKLWEKCAREISLFIIILAISHIAMISWFTVGAGALSEGELYRLHGRYLNPVLVFMPFIFILSLSEINSKKVFLYSTTQILIISAIYFLITKFYKIFPWDYPLLFAFYSPNNWYSWNYDGSLTKLDIILISIIISINLIAVFFRRKINFIKNLFILNLVFIFIFGIFQTYLWAYNHLKALVQINSEAKSLGLILDNSKMGSGTLIADNAYGEISFALFNLSNAPKVVIREKNSEISQDDIGNSSWVIFMGDYNPKFIYKNDIVLDKFRLFPINTNIAVDNNAENVFNLRGPYKINLGSGLFSSASLVGFNSQEEWGSWTKNNQAKIILPSYVSGNFKVVLFGWTIPENLNKPVIVRIGSQEKRLFLTDKNASYELNFSLSQPTDSIRIESHISRPNNSARDMGVALNMVQIENINASK